jgi:multicomponent K+:H+ antiporter subunit G
MAFLLELLVSFLIVVGGVFALVGSYGLIKLPDLMSRLHAPTKATTLGVGGTLLASMVYFAAFGGGFTVHELLITLFLFLTAPITANFLAKAYMHQAIRPEALPSTSTGGETGWATFDDPEPPEAAPQNR